MLERADRVSRLGRFGVLVIGFKDGRDLDKPVRSANVNGLDDILYFAPYREENVYVEEFEHNAKSERFMLPKTYQIDLNADLPSTSAARPQRDRPHVFKRVHHSRVVHIAEGLLEDDIYGVPALEPVYNLLDDLLKVVGGSAEMFWLSSRQGLNINVQDDAELDPDDEANLDSNLEDYFHQLTRVIKTRNADVKQLTGETIDPSGPFNVIQQLIAAATGLPARVLFGSEQGELASTQDSISFAQKVMERQQSFAEPMILRALLDKLQVANALPEANNIEIEWPDPMTMSPDAQAEVMRKESRAILDTTNAAISAKEGGIEPTVNPEQFRDRWFNDVEDDDADTE